MAQESIFIDIMMNVGIIFYAAQQTKTRRCSGRDRALPDHAALSWSVATAAPRTRASSTSILASSCAQTTHQGWRSDSAGRAGKPGRSTASRPPTNYGDERFLDTAERCADFYIDRTPGARRSAERLGGAQSDGEV